MTRPGPFRDYVERVRAAHDIGTVIRSRVELNGTNTARCPFHDDHTPSFSVHPRDQYFFCFGCGLGGDVFRFLELVDEIEFREAVDRLAMEAGIPRYTTSCGDSVAYEAARTRRTILEATVRYYKSRMTAEARAYLAGRGIPDEIVSRFGLGWADGKLGTHLKGQGFAQEAAIEAGVLRRQEDGSIRDFFSKRIVFPIIAKGEVVHLTARGLSDARPKYLHIPGPLTHFYNERAVNETTVFVVEGPIDALTLAAWDIPAVALLGATSRLDVAVERLAAVERVYLCLDSDAAGERGATVLCERLGARCRVVMLPAGNDVNDLLVAGEREKFESLVKTAKDLITLRIEQVPAETPKLDLVEVLGPVLDLLTGVDGPRMEAHLDLIKERFDLRREEIEGYRKLVGVRRREAQATAEADQDDVKPPTLTADFDGLVDLVEADGRSAFLIQAANGPELRFSIELDGTSYVPPPVDQIPWLLPRGQEAQRWVREDTDRQLFLDLCDYHRSISELPSDAHYTLLAAWDFHTYLLQHAEYSPYLWLYGVPERGKSRTGKGLIYVAYRGLHVESLREAYLLRAARDLRATIFFDVMDLWRKADRSQSEDILLMRFERGARVPRVLYPDRGALRDTVYYEIFGASVLGTNEPIHHIMETRALLIALPETNRKFEGDVTPFGARSLRERLVAFRARHMDSRLPKTDKPCRGRLGDITRPLVQVLRLVCPEAQPVLLDLLRKIETARRLQKTESLEAQIVAAIRSLEEEVRGGILPVKRITDVVNEPRGEREKVTPQKVGRRLDALGFGKAKTSSNSSAIHWNEEFLRRVELAYGFRETPETPETPDPLFINELRDGVSSAFPPNTGTNTKAVTDCESTTPGVSGVSGESRSAPEGPHAETSDDDEAFEERAAILEFECGLDRKSAETKARACLRNCGERG
jgi:DNA primase catalytic core